MGRTCGGIEHGVVAAPAPFGKDGRFWGTGGCGGHSSVVSALGATEGATGGGENWAESEGHEPEAAERRAVQPLESPLRQPERSPAATNTFGGQNCGEEGGGAWGVPGSAGARAGGRRCGGRAGQAPRPDRLGSGGEGRTGGWVGGSRLCWRAGVLAGKREGAEGARKS